MIPIVTIDIDWAPDFMINDIADRLLDAGVKATWFVTHPSPAIDRLRNHRNLFELGIHPNFLPGSTQGNTPEAVLNYCMAVVPDAVSMRTHGLAQSTPLLAMVLQKTPVRRDASLFLPRMRHVEAVAYQWQGKTLWRYPYVWEDDFEMERARPDWSPNAILSGTGLRIFDFHPVHVFLNSRDMKAYRSLCTNEGIPGCKPDSARCYRTEEPGTRTFFDNLVRVSKIRESLRIADLPNTSG